MAKRMAEKTKALMIGRRQRTRWRRIRHVRPRVDRLLLHQKRPPPELREVLPQQVKIHAQLVEIALTIAPVAATQLADHQDDPTRSRHDRRTAGENRRKVHSSGSVVVDRGHPDGALYGAGTGPPDQNWLMSPWMSLVDAR